MICSWQEPYRLEAAFARIITKQKERGFLVDQRRILKNIATLGGKIAKIDKEALPQLPLRIIIKEVKKDGEYAWVKKPFKKNGELNQYSMDYSDLHYPDGDTPISGPYTRIEFGEFDLGSTAGIKIYLLSQGWVPEEWNHKKDDKHVRTSPKLSQDDKFLGVSGNVGQLIASRMVLSHRMSQSKGFLKRIREDGRMTADTSGLCPTSRLKHKGIVNIPNCDSIFGSEMRLCFIAAEGYRIVGCDAASCQLRMLCHYMGDEDYTRAVVEGKSDDGTDIHSVNMRLTGLDSRGAAKTFIYAFLFGAGDENLAAQLGVTVGEVRKTRARFMRKLPRLKNLVDSLKRVWKERGYLIGLDGRKIFVRSEHMLLVYLLQSAEAVMMKVATCFADKWVVKRNIDAGMVAHIHDEFQWEVIKSASVEVGELLSKAIVQAGVHLKLTVPMAGEYKVGLNWKETH